MTTLTRQRPVWAETPSLVERIAKALVLTGIALAVLFPIYVVVLTSFSPASAINEAGGLVVIPRGFSLAAYAELFAGGVVTRAVAVSVGVTVVGTAISLSATILAAYGLSRPGSLLHRPLLFLVLLTFLFSPGMIPSYLLVSSLGLIDSYWALILPTAINAFNLVVMRAFFRLFYAVGCWNAFFNAILYINDNAKWPLQLVLRQYVQQGQNISVGALADASQTASTLPPSLALQMAIVVIALVPVLVLYPFVQRHFTKGVIIGAVKG